MCNFLLFLKCFHGLLPKDHKRLTEMYIYPISTLAKYVRHFEIIELSLSESRLRD